MPDAEENGVSHPPPQYNVNVSSEIVPFTPSIQDVARVPPLLMKEGDACSLACVYLQGVGCAELEDGKVTNGNMHDTARLMELKQRALYKRPGDD